MIAGSITTKVPGAHTYTTCDGVWRAVYREKSPEYTPVSHNDAYKTLLDLLAKPSRVKVATTRSKKWRGSEASDRLKIRRKSRRTARSEDCIMEAKALKKLIKRTNE